MGCCRAGRKALLEWDWQSCLCRTGSPVVEVIKKTLFQLNWFQIIHTWSLPSDLLRKYHGAEILMTLLVYWNDLVVTSAKTIWHVKLCWTQSFNISCFGWYKSIQTSSVCFAWLFFFWQIATVRRTLINTSLSLDFPRSFHLRRGVLPLPCEELSRWLWCPINFSFINDPAWRQQRQLH